MHLRDLTNFLVPWHWHEEVELGYIDCGASQIITTGGTYDVHAGEAFFINTNVDMKRNGLPGERTLEVNHIFHPVFLAGHFKSRFETKYLKPVLNNRQIDVHVIRPASDTGEAILRNLKELRALQEEPDMEFQTRNLLSVTWLLLIEDIEKNGAVRRSSERQDRIRIMLAFDLTQNGRFLFIQGTSALLDSSPVHLNILQNSAQSSGCAFCYHEPWN